VPAARLALKGRRHSLVIACYVAMGWIVVFVVKPLVAALPSGGLALLAACGRRAAAPDCLDPSRPGRIADADDAIAIRQPEIQAPGRRNISFDSSDESRYCPPAFVRASSFLRFSLARCS
jgi:hypothetical protein